MIKTVYIDVIIIAFLSACSTKGSYESNQISRKHDCQKLPPSQYDDCMESTRESFESYNSKREDVINQK